MRIYIVGLALGEENASPLPILPVQICLSAKRAIIVADKLNPPEGYKRSIGVARIDLKHITQHVATVALDKLIELYYVIFPRLEERVVTPLEDYDLLEWNPKRKCWVDSAGKPYIPSKHI